MVFGHRCITINFDWVFKWNGPERSLLKIVRIQFFAFCAFERAGKFFWHRWNYSIVNNLILLSPYEIHGQCYKEDEIIFDQFDTQKQL